MRYGDVVAIVGDADLWCLPCARKRYGSRVVKAVVDGKRHEDSEGNYLGVIGYGTEDCYNLDGPRDKQGRMQPSSCGRCHQYIVEDDREMTETVTLHDVGGIARKYGTDEHGNQWTEFEVDYLAEQEPGECSICGATIDAGYMCLDGGDEVCYEHVTLD